MAVLSDLFAAPVVAGERRGDVPLDSDATPVADAQGVDGTPLDYAADRSHLVKKVITNKLGRRQTVWVRPGDAGPAEKTAPAPEPPKKSPRKAAPEPKKAPRGGSGAVDKLRAGGALSRDDLAALPGELAALTVPQLRELQAALGAAGGRVKADRVQKLLALVSAAPAPAAASPDDVAAAVSADPAAAPSLLSGLDHDAIVGVAVRLGLPEAAAALAPPAAVADQIAAVVRDRAADEAEVAAAAASWDAPLDLDQSNPDDPVARAVAADGETRALLEGYLRATPPDVRAVEDGYAVAQRRAATLFAQSEAARAAGDPAAYLLQARWRQAVAAVPAMQERLAAVRVAERVAFVSAARVARPAPFRVEKATPATAGRTASGAISSFTPTEERAVKSASSFLSAITAGPPVAVEVVRANSGRAHYNPWAKVLAMDAPPAADAPASVRIAGQTTTHVVVHELGHAIEYQKPGVLAAAGAFLAYRVGDEAPVDMGGDMVGEVGRRDRFERVFSPTNALYVGKAYPGNPPPTEIVSMGVEELFRNPTGFIRRDPEYAVFLLGQLRRSP